MKKLFVTLAFAAVACLFVSCDTKVCACYEYTSTGVVPNDIYVSEDTHCTSQDKGQPGNIGSRVCMEDNERLSAEEIANLGQSYKRQ